jgi:hypothetical protein
MPKEVCIEGKQGPELKGREMESYILFVISGSERVYVNGIY